MPSANLHAFGTKALLLSLSLFYGIQELGPQFNYGDVLHAWHDINFNRNIGPTKKINLKPNSRPVKALTTVFDYYIGNAFITDNIFATLGLKIHGVKIVPGGTFLGY
nr:hypothetical protein CFP56_43227 [Quercus suber]